jgi:hypothetical protein
MAGVRTSSTTAISTPPRAGIASGGRHGVSNRCVLFHARPSAPPGRSAVGGFGLPLRFIKRAKQVPGYHFKQRFGTTLWQRYGYEHVLRGDEDTLSVARYILENPLRAGLVESVEDYPFLGSTMYSVREILEAVEMRPPSRTSR